MDLRVGTKYRFLGINCLVDYPLYWDNCTNRSRVTGGSTDSVVAHGETIEIVEVFPEYCRIMINKSKEIGILELRWLNKDYEPVNQKSRIKLGIFKTGTLLKFNYSLYHWGKIFKFPKKELAIVINGPTNRVSFDGQVLDHIDFFTDTHGRIPWYKVIWTPSGGK